MKPSRQLISAAAFPLLATIFSIWLMTRAGTAVPDNVPVMKKVKVVFSGGHETDPVDHGRPVTLVAGALGVSPQVFRDAFRNVRPAPGGQEPEPERVRQNKAVLMKALTPYGVTNARLDEVSNYYRIRPGELWPVEAAQAVAIVEFGVVTRFEVIKGGSGYSSLPKIKVPGYQIPGATVELSYGKDFRKNGSVTAIVFEKSKYD